MSVLLLRLCGPMQSWGVQSRFGWRDTGLEPSKSGVCGLLCAAMGRPRTAPVEDLALLRMGVRVDREGVLYRDFHTAQNVLRASGGLKETELSIRDYLADACFLVALEGDFHLLGTLHAALRDPTWPLYLGRKCFVPSESVWLHDGLHEGITLVDALALTVQPLLCAPPPNATALRLILEQSTGPQERRDQPISFAEGQRRFGLRYVRTDYIRLPIQTADGA